MEAKAKKRFFKNVKKSLEPQKAGLIGNKSVKPREKIEIKKKSEFPNNYLNFPEWLSKIGELPENKLFLLSIVYILTLSLMGNVFITANTLRVFANTLKNRGELTQKLSVWENIAYKYPTYRDANFQAALIAYQLGDKNTERKFLERTFAIDPNFEPAKNLLELSQKGE